MFGTIATKCQDNQAVHTKVGECSMFEGRPKGFLIHSKDLSFDIDTSAFNTAIRAAIYGAGRNRVTPLMEGMVDSQFSGGDIKTSQEGFGPEKPIGLNAKRGDYIFDKGGICLFKQLKKLDKRQMRVFLVDEANIAYGTTEKVNDKLVVKGFLATIGVSRRDNNGSQDGAVIVSLFFDANYENEEMNMSSIALEGVIEGLTGVVLKKTATGKAKLVVACSGDDLTDTYGAVIAVPTLYVNEAGENPTSVTYSSVTSDLTFLPAEAKYKLVDAKSLSEASIEGIEGEDGYTDLK